MKNVPTAQISQLSKKIETALGLYFPPDRHTELLKKLAPAAAEFGADDTAQLVTRLLEQSLSREAWDVLAKYLTIGETYFFREPAAFDALNKNILPTIFRDPRRVSRQIRVWSAAASTGEEAYSLAMHFDRLLPNHPGWSATIFATDVNVHALTRAMRGIFRRWSFRKIPETYRRMYFTELPDGTFEISEKIRRMVIFSPLNLVMDDYPSHIKKLYDMDIIFCRNVLIYFSPQTIQKVVTKLVNTLVSGGWLVVSPSEAPHIAADGLQRHLLDGTTLFRKTPVRRQASPFGTRFLDPQNSLAANVPRVKPIFNTTRKPVQPAGEAQSRQNDDKYARALQFYENGAYSAAAEILEEILTTNDGALARYPDAVQLLVHTYANRRDLTQAKAWAQRATEIDKLNPRYHYLLATILHAEEDEQAAIAALKKALFLKDDFALAHFMMGNLLQRQGKTDAALRHYKTVQKILQATPPDAKIYGSEDMTAATLNQLLEQLLQNNGHK